jgi:hypothetical protein
MLQTRKPLPSIVPLLALAALAGTAQAQGQSIDLSSWTTVQYDFNAQGDASWELQPGNTAVLQTRNSDASLFLSDFDAAGREIRGTWRVDTSGDDDFMGFVFGYQDRGHFYLFDWKQASQSYSGAFAEVGMTLKAVDMPAGQDPTIPDLWSSTSSANVTVLAHNTVPWDEFVDYEFELSFVPGTIEIRVLEGSTVLESWVVSDSTYTAGNFGFYNFSQDQVLYQGFTQQSALTIYCTAKVNSQGCTPALAVTGTPGFSEPGPFDIEATSLINRMNGVLFYGVSGRASLPFAGGTLCVEGPLERTLLLNTGGSPTGVDCSGSLSVDFNALVQGGGAPTVMPGDKVNAQFFYRDPQHSDGTGHGLTEAVEFVVLP